MDGNVTHVLDMITRRLDSIDNKIDNVRKEVGQVCNHHDNRLEDLEKKAAANNAVSEFKQQSQGRRFAISTLIITTVTAVVVILMDYLLGKL